jgi:hypothetical protein
MRCARQLEWAEHRELPLPSGPLRLEDGEGSLSATIDKQHHAAA